MIDLVRFASAVFVLCLSTGGVIFGASAQGPDLATSGRSDDLCDYCKDFTDAATAIAPIRSAYHPGHGYLTERE